MAVVALPSDAAVSLFAEASTTTSPDHLVVRIQDPVADLARYRAEFRRREMNIDLQVVAATAARTGKVLFLEDRDNPAGRPEIVSGRCGIQNCGVAVKVPVNYRSYASIVFGRPAKPGEMYDTGPGDSPGEGIGLPDITAYRVLEAVAALRKRNLEIEYRYSYRGSDQPYPKGVPASQVRPDWYVHDGLHGDAGQVILFVGPEAAG
ncbi:hypothetical protein HCN51_42570 [Nonomuraea sp. FMUSA5-5]|uniref:PASTA domain-containing protein n=1 Tax=Nonomuraea composti TaxID=2720023 RepID=A0ABX1BLQ7_9ACTN|nr:hypothetical protein [Nonomuraea sp. FMUSA5-5]NJP96048.1 hypothetical protein [Nonomuraea sp. FMUSA5-5]